MRLAIFVLAILTSASANAADMNEKLKDVSPQEKPFDMYFNKIDLLVDHNFEYTEPDDNMPEVLDLDSDYSSESSAAARKRGDVSVKPKFGYVDPDDPTISDTLEKEKEYKLEFNIGL